MKRIIVSFLIALCSLMVSAQNGINFEHTSFNEACELAKQQNKLVFIDVYTQWCGPCLLMADEVFSLDKVGQAINGKFVSLKIDAEHGEGISFAKKYRVQSFPAYYFIDPETKEVLHRSGGRHDADKFLKIAACSMNPKLRSSYLYPEYEKGNRDPEFMFDYINGMDLSYDKKNQTKAIDELLKIKGDDLSDKILGEVFFNYISDRDHPLFKKFVTERAKMEKQYGKERVEKKLYKGYRWCRDTQRVSDLEDFKGKDYILAYHKLKSTIDKKDYETADKLVMDMFTNPSFDQKTVMTDIKFTAKSTFYKEVDKEWEKKCIKYLQYIAYNARDRNEGENHFNYAYILEKIIKENPEIHEYFPESITQEPETGKTKYSLRSPNLKKKPQR
ncbi:thioredoxin family protein [Carboxylicivirga sp. N1Y90]|uniref:thioredoxin family protein n=1 Tax=Carboxylicivirga fragile TaxID=3417571 RepID=UPI003D34FFC5|nr:thioredoxin family protein [Marinilabiliaceae bacterium N1Y90]